MTMHFYYISFARYSVTSEVKVNLRKDKRFEVENQPSSTYIYNVFTLLFWNVIPKSTVSYLNTFMLTQQIIVM